jgi:hypothetical protein
MLTLKHFQRLTSLKIGAGCRSRTRDLLITNLLAFYF